MQNENNIKEKLEKKLEAQCLKQDYNPIKGRETLIQDLSDSIVRVEEFYNGTIDKEILIKHLNNKRTKLIEFVTRLNEIMLKMNNFENFEKGIVENYKEAEILESDTISLGKALSDIINSLQVHTK